jgi:hypothetical protein
VTGTTFINNQTDSIHNNVASNAGALSIHDVLDVVSEPQGSGGTGGGITIVPAAQMTEPELDTTSHLSP